MPTYIFASVRGTDIEDSRLVFLPVETASEPKDGLPQRCLKDYWWIFEPTRGILFYRQTAKSKHLSPQCNSNRVIAEQIRSRLYPWAEIKQVPKVFVDWTD